MLLEFRSTIDEAHDWLLHRSLIHCNFAGKIRCG